MLGFDSSSHIPGIGELKQSSSFHMLCLKLYDGSLDDVHEDPEPEICSILSGSDDERSSSKDASTKRFAVRPPAPRAPRAAPRLFAP